MPAVQGCHSRAAREQGCSTHRDRGGNKGQKARHSLPGRHLLARVGARFSPARPSAKLGRIRRPLRRRRRRRAQPAHSEMSRQPYCSVVQYPRVGYTGVVVPYAGTRHKTHAEAGPDQSKPSAAAAKTHLQLQQRRRWCVPLLHTFLSMHSHQSDCEGAERARVKHRNKNHWQRTHRRRGLGKQVLDCQPLIYDWPGSPQGPRPTSGACMKPACHLTEMNNSLPPCRRALDPPPSTHRRPRSATTHHQHTSWPPGPTPSRLALGAVFMYVQHDKEGYREGPASVPAQLRPRRRDDGWDERILRR